MRTIYCTIERRPISYPIEIDSFLLQKGGSWVDRLRKFARRIAIITDERVEVLYGRSLRDYLEKAGFETIILSFPPGEMHKTRETKGRLEDQLFSLKMGRDCSIIALGGGIVMDVGGYLAATYCRGIPLVLIPTTLLAMVDASIGGKTGLNLLQGKNRIGVIYQPHFVLIDPAFLQTLPRRELYQGIVEMIKHGVICDEGFFALLEEKSEKMVALDHSTLEELIAQSCLIKKNIVEIDERDEGRRNLLNFGHTVGHALEGASDYRLSHGVAVAVGMVIEMHLAVELAICQREALDKLVALLTRYAIPLSIGELLSWDKVISLMRIDKKSMNGKIGCVLIEKIGSASPSSFGWYHFVQEDAIRNSFAWFHSVWR